MSKLEVDAVEPQSGTSLTLGASGDTVTVPSGATLDASNATLTLPDNSVATAKLQDDAVTTAKIDDDAVTTAKIDDGAITSAKLAAGVGGKVLQVVSANNVLERSTTSTSFVTASNTLTINITPSSASSKIYINVTSSMYVDATGAGQGYFTIYRDATNLGGSTSGFGNIYIGGTDTDMGTFVALSILDEPNTTSAITYQVYIRSGNVNDTIIMSQESTSKSTITAFEIAG